MGEDQFDHSRPVLMMINGSRVIIKWMSPTAYKKPNPVTMEPPTKIMFLIEDGWPTLFSRTYVSLYRSPIRIRHVDLNATQTLTQPHISRLKRVPLTLEAYCVLDLTCHTFGLRHSVHRHSQQKHNLNVIVVGLVYVICTRGVSKTVIGSRWSLNLGHWIFYIIFFI